MHRFSWGTTLGAFAAFAALVICGATAAQAAPVTIAAGTPVKVHVVDSLSSAIASPGTSFQIVAAEPLIVGGVIVATQGATGRGHVVAVTPAGKKGKQASISVQLDWLIAIDGQQLPLMTTAKPASGSSPASLVFGPGGPFAQNFVKNKDVVVGPDLVFSAYVSTDSTITSVTY